MKKHIKLILAVIVAALIFCSVLAIGVSASNDGSPVATSNDPGLTLMYATIKNIGESVTLKFAVDVQDFSEGAEPKLLVWKGARAGKDYYASTAQTTISEYQIEKVNGNDYYVFYYSGLNISEVGTNLYARAYCTEGSVGYYSYLVKYSVQQYAYSALNSTSYKNNTLFKTALDSFLNLAYGATGIPSIHKVELKNGMKFDDGFSYGYYKESDTFTLTAPAKSNLTFSHWEDESGKTVSNSTTLTVSVSGDNKYTPVYNATVTYLGNYQDLIQNGKTVTETVEYGSTITGKGSNGDVYADINYSDTTGFSNYNISSNDMYKNSEWLAREMLFYTDSGYTQRFDKGTPITENMTLYVAPSSHLHITGSQIFDLTKVTASLFDGVNVSDDTQNADGTVTLRVNDISNEADGDTDNIERISFELSQALFDYEQAEPLKMTTPYTTKFKVRFKITEDSASGYSASNLQQVSFYCKGTMDNNSETSEIGLSKNLADLAQYREGTTEWYTVVFDLSGKISANYIEWIRGVRFDVQAKSGQKVEVVLDYIQSIEDKTHTVTYIANGSTYSTETVFNGDNAKGLAGKKVNYYKDAAHTTPYDITSPVVNATTVYVDIQSTPNFYLDGTHIDNTFHIFPGAEQPVSVSKNEDGSAAISGINGSYAVYMDMNISLNGDNTLRVKAKFPSDAAMKLWIIGEYTLDNGTTTTTTTMTQFGESYSDLGAVYLSNGVDYGDGWYVFDFNLTQTEGLVFNKITGVRIDVIAPASYTIDSPAVINVNSIESFKGHKVTYLDANGAYVGSENVKNNSTITGLKNLGKTYTYYSNQACTAAFNMSTKITSELTLYVKSNDGFYYSPSDLLNFNKHTPEGATETTTALKDGVLEFTGGDGANINIIDQSILMNSHNALEIKIKLGSGVSGYHVFMYGDSDNGFVDKIQAHAKVTQLADGWQIIRFDADTTYTTYKGLRFDLYGTGTISIEYIKSYEKRPEYYVDYYSGDGSKLSDEIVEQGSTIKGYNAFGRVCTYYTDNQFTNEFDVTTPITQATKLYVKVNTDYVTLTDNDLLSMAHSSNAAGATLVDGKLQFTVAGTAVVTKKQLDLSVKPTTQIAVRFKYTGTTPTSVGFFFQGTDTNGNTFGESNFGLSITSAEFGTADSEGFYTVVFDFTTRANVYKGYPINKFTQLRFDVNGATGATVTVDSITTIPSYTVTYEGDLTGSELVMANGNATGLEKDGYEIKYYTDAAHSNEFDFSTPITSDTTIYVKATANGAIVTYSGYKNATELVAIGGTIKGIQESYKEILYYKDSACVVPFNKETPITENITIYTRGSEYVYFDASTLSNWVALGEKETVNGDELKVTASVTSSAGRIITNSNAGGIPIFPGTTKFEIRAKFDKTKVSQLVLFLQETAVDGGTASNSLVSVYYSLSGKDVADADGYYTIAFDLSGKLTAGTSLTRTTRLMLDVYSVAASDTVDITIDYIKSEASPLTLSGSELSQWVSLGEKETVNGDELKVTASVTSSAGRIITNSNAGGIPIFPGTTKFEIRAKFDKTKVSQLVLFLQETAVDGGTASGGMLSLYYAVTGNEVADADGYYTIVFDLSGKLTAGTSLTRTTRLMLDVYSVAASDTVDITIDYIKSAASPIVLKGTTLSQWVALGEDETVNADDLKITASVTDASCRVITNNNGGGIPVFPATTRFEMRIKFDPAQVDQLVLHLQESEVEGGTAANALRSIYYTITGNEVADADGYYTIVFDLSAKLTTGTSLTKTTRLMIDVSPVGGSGTVEVVIDYIKTN